MFGVNNLKSACNYPGCPEVIKAGERFCQEHWKLHRNQQDKRRGKTKERGYGGRWQKIRKRVLAEQPFCNECKREGKITEANVVHHIDGDVWNVKRDNLESLCKQCHDRITMKEMHKGG